MKCHLGKRCSIRDQIASFKTDAALNQSIAAALEGNAHRIASVLATYPMPANVCIKLAEILQKAMMSPPQLVRAAVHPNPNSPLDEEQNELSS